MSSSILNLPIVTIQDSFSTVIYEVESGLVPLDKFWVSCYLRSQTSVHAEVRVELDEKDRNLVRLQPNNANISLEKNGDNYAIACPPLGIPLTRVVLPQDVYMDPRPTNTGRPPLQVLAFDVAPDGSQYATGFSNGSVRICSLSSGSSSATGRSHAKPHLSSITSLQFFPSSRVLLTAGADFSLTILPAEPQITADDPFIKPVREFKGHTRAITSTGIIARGRSILSASKDGTIRLWDVSSGAQIKSLVAGKGKFTAVSAISVGDKGAELGLKPPNGEEVVEVIASPTSIDDREVETTGKVLWAALEDGSFEAFDLGSKQSIYQSSKGSAALSTIRYHPSHNLLATGSTHGVVTLYDTRNLSTPLTSFARNSASVEDLDFFISDQGVGLVIAPLDGLPFIAGVMPAGPEVLAEFVGLDCDGVRAVRVRGELGRDIWMASDDGIVRRYVI